MRQDNMLIVGAFLLTVGSFSWFNRIQASEQQIKPSDKVIALYDTYVQAGTEKLAAVEAGAELVAGAVQGDWVAVTVEQEGKKISGWIHSSHLILNAEIGFAGLVVRVTSDVDWLTTEDFNRMDRDTDGSVTVNEFLTDSRAETFDDLNEQLRRELVAHDEAMRPVGHFLRGMSPNVVYFDPLSRFRWLSLQILQPTRSTSQVNVTFKSWKRKPFRHEAEQMADDFLKTGDIRRSPVAQQLVDREAPEIRAGKAQALFQWADKNRDGKLSLEEFKRALGAKDDTGAGLEKPVPAERDTSSAVDDASASPPAPSVASPP